MGTSLLKSPSDETCIGELSNRFQVRRLIGTGGMGVVLAAHDKELEREVAVKLVRCGHGSADRARRLLREAETAAKLRSPHVARTLGVGWLDAQSPFIVMELLAGRDLGAVLRAEGPLPPLRACRLILEACAGVLEAHAIGMIHRDLKPGNLFLVEQPGALESIKVLDFGLAKDVGLDAATTNLTRGPTFVGTPRYMAPEQLTKHQRLDGRVDVWALAVTLYELISGRLPFRGQSAELIHDILTAPPPPLPESVATPPELERLLLRSLEKAPDDRTPSLRAFASKLRAITDAMSATMAQAPPAALSSSSGSSSGSAAGSSMALEPRPDSVTLETTLSAPHSGAGEPPPLPRPIRKLDGRHAVGSAAILVLALGLVLGSRDEADLRQPLAQEARPGLESPSLVDLVSEGPAQATNQSVPPGAALDRPEDVEPTSSRAIGSTSAAPPAESTQGIARARDARWRPQTAAPRTELPVVDGTPVPPRAVAKSPDLERAILTRQ